MEYQPIKNLLDKYFLGETTLAEEASLRDYFNSHPVDERLKEYAPLFEWMASEQDLRLEETQLTEMLDKLEPVKAKTVRMKTSGLLWVARIAAVLVLVVGMWWAYQYQQTNDQTAEVDWSKYEITDEREALIITRGALLQASQTLNKGANAAAGQMDRMQEIGKFFK